MTTAGAWRFGKVSILVMPVAACLTLALGGWMWARPLAAAAPEGAELFTTHCATCHGIDGTGNGPMARQLRQVPTDLTGIARKNGGIFPAVRVRRIIEGREVESHGDRDMPVWGDAFKTSRDGLSPETAEARIAAIVVYLESIQHREAQ